MADPNIATSVVLVFVFIINYVMLAKKLSNVHIQQQSKTRDVYYNVGELSRLPNYNF